MHEQPPKELLDALLSPREEATDVLPSSCLCFKGPNYLRGFPWPTSEEGYPRLIALTSELGFYGEAGNEPPACGGPT